ncbi:hypothetical protein [Nocardioides sp.]|uniref:hypothetical protein n=1 Tax=Nocardioides sp. TaxID=35761 RepID=UPI0037843FFD
MSEPTTPQGARPGQVTLVGWLTMVGSALVVLLVFDRLAGLHTLETRQSVEKFLSEPPGSGLGVGVEGVLTLIRTLAMVTAGCATAAAILGYHVLRRSRSARLGLTVLAVPLFVGGLATGGFVSSMVAASAVMLWLQPARDWFAGVSRPAPDSARRPEWPPPAPPPTASPTASQTPTTVSPTPPHAVAPPATHAAVPPRATAARAAVTPYATSPHPAAVTAPVPSSRPTAVAVACALTWAGSGLSALGMALTALLLALEPDTLLDEVHRQNPDLAQQGVSDDLLVGVTYAMIAGIGLWCLAAVVLAVLVFRGVEWARLLLVISATTAAALSLLGAVFGAFLLVLTLVASGITVVLLVRPEVRAWFRRGR